MELYIIIYLVIGAAIGFFVSRGGAPLLFIVMTLLWLPIIAIGLVIWLIVNIIDWVEEIYRRSFPKRKPKPKPVVTAPEPETDDRSQGKTALNTQVANAIVERFNGQPVGYLLWKGTTACMDLRCKCGADSHIDAMFAYHVTCPSCGTTYMCNSYIELIEVQEKPSWGNVTGELSEDDQPETTNEPVAADEPKPMAFVKVAPLGARAGDGTFDTFYDTTKYRSLGEATDAGDCVVVDFVADENGTLYFDAWHTRKPNDHWNHRLAYQLIAAGVDVADDNSACALVDQIFKLH